MSEPRPFASLSPSLLARKGSARPAMRPQLRPLAFDGEWAGGGGSSPFGFGSRPQFDPQDDLGWNDMGFDMGFDGPFEEDGTVCPAEPGSLFVQEQAHRETAAAPAQPVSAQPVSADPVSATPAPAPVVVAITPDAAVVEPAGSPVLRQIDSLAEKISKMIRRKPGSALAEGRKAAFTLRVDQHRHLRLRLACALQNRSAQQLLTEALDRLLADMPELNDLAAKMTRN